MVVACLADLKFAYEAILVFMLELDTFGPSKRELLFLPYQFRNLRGGRYFREIPIPELVASFVPHREQLILNSVHLNSPGAWEFLGSLSALEVLRKYLCDQHERRKDRQYRESADERRMSLENLALENKVIAERIKMAKEIGATDSDLAPLLNGLIFKPLSALDRYQDKGVIDGAELIRLTDERKG